MKPNDTERGMNSHEQELRTDGRDRVNEHDPTNAWGERVVEGEGIYPGPEALADEAPDADPEDLNSAHGGDDYHNGAWPGLER